MGQLTYSTAEIQKFLDKVHQVFHKGSGTGSTSGGSYTIFARQKKQSGGTSSHSAAIIVNYGGALYGKRGCCLLETINRNGNFALNVTVLAAHSSGTVTFGYYEDGDYRYIGVYRSFTYGAEPELLLLDNTWSTCPFEVGDYGIVYSAPTGWTAATT